MASRHRRKAATAAPVPACCGAAAAAATAAAASPGSRSGWMAIRQSQGLVAGLISSAAPCSPRFIPAARQPGANRGLASALLSSLSSSAKYKVHLQPASCLARHHCSRVEPACQHGHPALPKLCSCHHCCLCARHCNRAGKVKEALTGPRVRCLGTAPPCRQWQSGQSQRCTQRG